MIECPWCDWTPEKSTIQYNQPEPDDWYKLAYHMLYDHIRGTFPGWWNGNCPFCGVDFRATYTLEFGSVVCFAEHLRKVGGPKAHMVEQAILQADPLLELPF